MGFILCADISYKKITSEHFLFDRKTGFIHSFNDCGTFIFDLLMQDRSVNEIVSELTSAYNISEELAQNDLKEFLDDLIEKKLITSEES